jgi:NADPH-dependent 2,4-dienoyl-CoA reductase/sulfur reductase-like enzyme
MRCWTRRELAGLTGAALMAVTPSRLARGQARRRVIVIGGGVGGATVARYVAMTGKNVEVVLIEPKTHYTTCFFSNLYLAGLRSLESLSHGYEVLAGRHGITVIHEAAVSIDPAVKAVELATGTRLHYDRLVLSPGIAFKFDAIEGYDKAASEMLPHAWTAGPQSELLRRQLVSMEDGGVFAVVIPPDPIRCPPAPYERASLVASFFKQHKPKAKVLILDAKDTFKQQDLFQEAWESHYPGMIEWLPAQFTGGVKSIDVKGRAIRTAGDTFRAAVINVIPAHVAGNLARQSGLADKSGWCPVDPITFESTLQNGIHLVGDAIVSGDMPKSAFSANVQAKACAFAIAAALTGVPRVPPHLFNTCFTFLAPEDAYSNAIVYRPEAGRLKAVHTFVNQVNEGAEIRQRVAREASDWYRAFTADVFGLNG